MISKLNNALQGQPSMLLSCILIIEALIVVWIALFGSNVVKAAAVLYVALP